MHALGACVLLQSKLLNADAYDACRARENACAVDGHAGGGGSAALQEDYRKRACAGDECHARGHEHAR